MKPFEDVLAAGGPLVASWDRHDDDRTRLCLFAIGPANASMVADTRVPRDQQEAMNERLLAVDVRIGGSYANSLFVWTADEREFSVWSNKAAWRIPHGEPVVGVTVFYVDRDVGHHGVRVTLASGGHEILAEENDPTPRLDPVYNADDLEDDTRWARCLGKDLAVWFLCSFDDEIFPTTAERHLTIARALGGLADEVAASSAEIVRSLGPIGPARELVYRCTASTLELQVSGTTTSTVVLKRGTRAQIAAFLRRVSTPATTLWLIHDLLNQQPEG